MNRIAIAGSIEFDNEGVFNQKVDSIIKNMTGLIEIVSGDDPGTEEMALWYAEAKKLRYKSIPTLWDDIDDKSTSEVGITEHGERYWINAGTVRNKQIVDYCSHLIAFLSKEDKTTKELIFLATRHELKVRTIMIDEYLE